MKLCWKPCLFPSFSIVSTCNSWKGLFSKDLDSTLFRRLHSSTYLICLSPCVFPLSELLPIRRIPTHQTSSFSPNSNKHIFIATASLPSPPPLLPMPFHMYAYPILLSFLLVVSLFIPQASLNSPDPFFGFRSRPVTACLCFSVCVWLCLCSLLLVMLLWRVMRTESENIYLGRVRVWLLCMCECGGV